MFTGLVEAVGTVEALRFTAEGSKNLMVRTGLSGLAVGDSVSVNGVCLTVTFVDSETAHMDIGPETARVSSLGSVQSGRRVNLERAMPANGRFGGHLVQGHVDGVGALKDIRTEKEAHWLTVEFPPDLAPYLIPRGALAVDGISLTVVGLEKERLDIMVMPFTWTHTNLSTAQVGDEVNLECDMVGKYVVRALGAASADVSRTTIAE
jgi:riboflavin synthase